MNGLDTYFAMGGYAVYVWPAFGLTALVMALLAIFSYRRLRAEERSLAELERGRPNRRSRSS